MNGLETRSDGIDATSLLAGDPDTQTCTHLTLIIDISGLSLLAAPHCSIHLSLSSLLFSLLSPFPPLPALFVFSENEDLSVSSASWGNRSADNGLC